MCRRLFSSGWFLIIIAIAGNVNAFADYKWVPLKFGDAIPGNSVHIVLASNRFVGRARHYDDILPAEIHENGSAIISSCGKLISKDQFEILTSSNGCEWKDVFQIDDKNDNIVRVGNAWDGEPILIGGHVDGYYDDYHIASIYSKTGKMYKWSTAYWTTGFDTSWRYLCCNMKTKWIEYLPSMLLPNNTVSAGKSNEGHSSYVARLKRNCQLITGEFIPTTGIARAFLPDGTLSEGRYSDLLIGEPNEYNWVAASKGEIPDYAVVIGRNGTQPLHVARINNAIRELTHVEAINESNYEILVTKPL